MKYVLDESQMQMMLGALKFYAECSNSEMIMNRHRVDWTARREELQSRGFRMNCEMYDGSEEYVEDGRTARIALDMLENIRYDADYEEHTRTQSDQQAQTQGEATDSKTT